MKTIHLIKKGYLIAALCLLSIPAESQPTLVLNENYSNPTTWTTVYGGGVGSIMVTGGPLGVCQYLDARDGYDKRTYRTLPIPLSDVSWRAECVFNYNPPPSSAGVGHHILAFTAGTQNPEASSISPNVYTNQDMIGVYITSPAYNSTDPTTWRLTVKGKDGIASFFAPSINVPTPNTNYYIRLERLDATHGMLSVFSNPGYTTHITGSPVCFDIPATVTGLTHLQHSSSYIGDHARRLTATVDNTIVYNYDGVPNDITYTALSCLQYAFNYTRDACGYSWDFGDMSPVSTQKNPTHTYAGPGTYNVTLTLSVGTSTVTLTKIITINIPTANAGADQTITACAGSTSTVLNGNQPPSGSKGMWIKVSGPPANITNPSQYNTSVSGLTRGIYTFRWTVTNSGNCTTSDDVTIYVIGGWPETAGQVDNSTEGNSVVTDNLGNVYVAGIFNRYTGQVGDNIHSTTTFGSLTVQTAADGENDYAFFLAKYNNCGVVQWAAIGYTHSSNKVYVGLNPMDNSHVYVAGSFFSTDIDIVDGKGIRYLPASNGNYNTVFLIRFNSSDGAFPSPAETPATPAQFLTVGQTTSTNLQGMAVTSDGVYLALNDNQSYISEYNFDLSLNAVKHSIAMNSTLSNSSSQHINLNAMAADQIGNIYAAGGFNGTLLGTVSTSPGPTNDFYIMKLSNTLTPIYAQKGGAVSGATGSVTAQPDALAIKNGIGGLGTEIYVTGIYAANGTGALFASPPSNPITGNGGFIAKYSEFLLSANRSWGIKAVHSNPSGIAVNPGITSNVVVVGNSYVDRYNFLNGNIIPGNVNAANGKGIYYSASHNGFLITGSFASAVTLNPPTISPVGTEDMFVARLSGASYFRNGDFETSENNISNNVLPNGFDLTIHPNPTANTTAVVFSLPEQTQVEISLVDITGKVLQKKAAIIYEEGQHNIELDLSQVNAGVYFIQITTPEKSVIKKVVKM